MRPRGPRRYPSAMQAGPKRAGVARAGVTMVELIIAMPVLLVSMTLFSGTVVSMIRQRSVNRDAALAAQEVQSLFERMRNEDLEDVFALYNADAFDDPGGPGTAPGGAFAVPTLGELNGGQGGVGEVLFPVLNAADPGEAERWELREDADLPELGMPRDLNRDFVIDELSHGEDYAVLPVSARVRWTGQFGPRELEMYTLLTKFRSPD